MTDTLTIRVARPSDLAEIDGLLGRSYPVLLKDHYTPSILVTAIPYISKAQPKLLKSGTYFVVLDTDGAIVGAGGWTALPPGREKDAGRSIGHIRHVVTDHRVVRRGIGRVLMQHVFESATAAGMTQLDCLSTRMAVPFYAACGFREVGPVSIDLMPGIAFPAVFMRREL